MSDLGDVLEEVFAVRAKWHNIGLKLKVDVGTLDSIGASHGGHDSKLREMLSVWLKGVKPRATWGALVSALKSQSVGEPQLADTLEKKYCTAAAAGT